MSHKHFYFFLFVLMSLMVTACGGDVTSEERLVDEPDQPIQQMTFHGCTPWKADEALHDLYIHEDYDTVREVHGLALNPNPIVTISTYYYTALAEWDGNVWQIRSVPSKIMQAAKLRRDGDMLYMTGSTPEHNPVLFSDLNDTWTEIDLPQETNQISDIWILDGTLYLLSETVEFTPLLYAWKNGKWTNQNLPDLSQPYRLNGIWNLGDKFFTFGSIVGEKKLPAQGLVLIRNENDQWQQVAVPSECKLIKSVHGLDMNHLALSGQTVNNDAVLYQVTEDEGLWKTYLDTELNSYSSLWWLDEDRLMVSGHTNLHDDDTNGKYTNLWAVDIKERVNAKFLQEISGYPIEMTYEPSTNKMYLLTERDLYSRTCR